MIDWSFKGADCRYKPKNIEDLKGFFGSQYIKLKKKNEDPITEYSLKFLKL